MQVKLEHIQKSFGEKKVLTDVTNMLNAGEIYCLMGPSGSGKTTLLRILLGLEQKDSGTIEGVEKCRFSAVFQENRLCEHLSAVKNVQLVLDKNWEGQRVREELSHILPEESLSQPVRELSGGMKRRVAICRALLADSEAVVMDEPFSGLDEETKKKVIDYIRQKAGGRLLIVSTHQMEDVGLLGGRIWKISSES